MQIFLTLITIRVSIKTSHQTITKKNFLEFNTEYCSSHKFQNECNYFVELFIDHQFLHRC
jgi:hypothetical protein